MTQEQHYLVVRGLLAWMVGYLTAASYVSGLGKPECDELANRADAALRIPEGDDGHRDQILEALRRSAFDYAVQIPDLSVPSESKEGG